MIRHWFLLALVVGLLVPTAAAHGAPDPRGQDTRLLADHNDDCGAHTTTSPERCNGTHDLIALDIQELYDPAFGDVVRFRFTMNAGTASDGLRDVLTFKANGASKTIELRTSNNIDFTGSGFDAVSKAFPATFPGGSADGERFIVEATVKVASLGGIGAKLTDYRIDAFRGTGKGDYVPGGYYNSLGINDADPSQGDADTRFVRSAGYVLRGPTYYATVTAPALRVQVGETAKVTLDVANGIRSAKWDTRQTATLTVQGQGGVAASWSSGGSTTIDLSDAGPAQVVLDLQGKEPGTTAITLTVATNLGGRTLHTFPVEVVVAPSSTSQASTEPSKSNDAPAPVAAFWALGLFALAGLRRRT